MSMERPVYHLKGVVRKGAAATEDFVGPLDLILHLLKKNQIAIRDIPLAGILDQFVTWMSAGPWTWRWRGSSSPWPPT